MQTVCPAFVSPARTQMSPFVGYQIALGGPNERRRRIYGTHTFAASVGKRIAVVVSDEGYGGYRSRWAGGLHLARRNERSEVPLGNRAGGWQRVLSSGTQRMEFGRGDPPQPPPQVRLRREQARRRVASMRRARPGISRQRIATAARRPDQNSRPALRGRRDGVADTPRRARRRWTQTGLMLNCALLTRRGRAPPGIVETVNMRATNRDTELSESERTRLN